MGDCLPCLPLAAPLQVRLSGYSIQLYFSLPQKSSYYFSNSRTDLALIAVAGKLFHSFITHIQRNEFKGLMEARLCAYKHALRFLAF